ncbi:hypothetical protein OOT46_19085 [Aquabacterium sp. A7-Y]|uniref:hypothetical protein n=1 Tax=Aquabacterium sp. A7-Y TaxID=1349605 RepID=UPI00223CE07F|nr:hypothetical protein [Aquabacterium sp. A7-Y]MCW7539945.1 hypothetical protein [Aquabacterium sp. A7-Y]
MAASTGIQRDSFDSRDLLYASGRSSLPEAVRPDWAGLSVRQQGGPDESAAHALASLADYLLYGAGQAVRVSASMLLATARRYDRWPGLTGRGPSARAVVQAWYKHGLCSEASWPAGLATAGLDAPRQVDALQRPMRTYCRVLPRRCDVQAALCEHGVLLCSAAVHPGWLHPVQGVIGAAAPQVVSGPVAGQAFVLAGYEPRGFLVLDSRGAAWGGLPVDGEARAGLALWPYEDFDSSVWDVWAATLALPVHRLAALRSRQALGGCGSFRRTGGPPPPEVARHMVHIDDGQFDPRGSYASTPESARELVQRKVAAAAARGELKLLLIAHGGLTGLDSAAERVRAWRDVVDANEVEHFHWLWETGFLPELKDVLLGKDEFAGGRAGVGEWKDRLLERLTRPLGKALWNEMKTDAALAHAPDGAGSQLLAMLGESLAATPQLASSHVTLLGDSAGALWLGEALQAWAVHLPQLRVDHLVLMAPCCTVEYFQRRIYPHLLDGRVQSLTVFQLPDELERADDVARVYGKSMLYYVSNACEAREGGTPLLGLQACAEHWEAERAALLDQGRLQLITAVQDSERSRATRHNGFVTDLQTLNTVLALACRGRPARPFTRGDLPGGASS